MSEKTNNISMQRNERVNVLGVGVNATSMPEAAERLLAARQAGARGYVCVTGAHGIMESQRDEALREIHNRSLMTVPDGMPTVWMGHEYGFVKMGRVYGPDLMLALCEATASRSLEFAVDGLQKENDETQLQTSNSQLQTDRKCLTHFLYGSTEETLRRLKANLEKKFPGIQIVGTYAPPFRPLTEEEELELQEIVADCKPDFFWVGLSTPKQEKFMASHSPSANDSFKCYDFHAYGRSAEAEGVRDENDSIKKQGFHAYGRSAGAKGVRRQSGLKPRSAAQIMAREGHNELNEGFNHLNPKTESTDSALKPNHLTPNTAAGKRHPLDAGIFLGVGAAFDIHSGKMKDTPKWIQNAGLQWLHRLCKEPRRLWRRYLWIVPGFAWLSFLQLMGLRRFPSVDCGGKTEDGGQRSEGRRRRSEIRRQRP